MPESLDRLWCFPSFFGEDSLCFLQEDRPLLPCCFRLEELLGVLDLFKLPFLVVEEDLSFDRLVECCRWRRLSSYEAGSELKHKIKSLYLRLWYVLERSSIKHQECVEILSLI